MGALISPVNGRVKTRRRMGFSYCLSPVCRSVAGNVVFTLADLSRQVGDDNLREQPDSACVGSCPGGTVSSRNFLGRPWLRARVLRRIAE